MGALPDRLVGFQHVENDELRERSATTSGACASRRSAAGTCRGMFDAMERGELTALYVIGENPLQSEADRHRTEKLLRGLDTLIVQDIFLTATAEIADVVLPAAAAWAESRGHGHQLRAARPAGAPGARAAGRGARRPVDHLRARDAHGRRLGRGRSPRRSGTRSASSRRSIAG